MKDKKRILLVSGKCSDLFDCEYKVNGEVLKEYGGYALEFEGLCGGDYIFFEVDLDTGKIVNWKPISHEDVIKTFEAEEDEYDEDNEDLHYTDENGKSASMTANEVNESIQKMLNSIKIDNEK